MLKYVLPLYLTLANPVYSQNTFMWGDLYITTLSLSKVEDNYQLVIYNRLSVPIDTEPLHITLTDEITVWVTYDDRNGTIPDIIALEIEPGYCAIDHPLNFSIEENTITTINIQECLTS